MKFMADKGVDRSIVDGLRALDFDMFFVVEQTRSLDDATLLELTPNESRILVTRDKDLAN